MSTLASFSGFLGTIWFMVIICAASFGAGVMFKTPFLKMITRGKYNG